MSSASAHCASATPAAAPRIASRKLSVSSWRINRPRPDPIERRTANSFCRAAPRASSKFARLAQAISKTSATRVMSSFNGAPKDSCKVEAPRPPGCKSIF